MIGFFAMLMLLGWEPHEPHRPTSPLSEETGEP